MIQIRDTPLPARGKAVGIQTHDMTMRFGSFTALDHVSIDVPAGSFHALLGENGAGKSTLVKCIMGFYHQTSGSLSVGDREVAIGSPKDAASYGLGMVYQHFTLVPSLTGAENLVISRAHVPAVINWARENRDLAEFMETMPFKIPSTVRFRNWPPARSRSWKSSSNSISAGPSWCSMNRHRC